LSSAFDFSSAAAKFPERLIWNSRLEDMSLPPELPVNVADELGDDESADALLL
jgi:hypothetical protein